MTKPAKKKPSERYKTADGDHLAIDERNDGYYIGWYLHAEQDFGAYVGEDPRHPRKPPDDKDDWECWVAHEAIKAFAEDTDNSRGFCFESRAKAKLAMAAANEALLTGNIPWPAWAITAKDAGWTPPDGWKP